ncbi:MAG: class I SAM-dependent methyltransferase [Patescibacteria group bacterium]
MPYIAKAYKRYQFRSGATLVRGRTPDFPTRLMKLVKPDFAVLDLGCGSGELALRLAPLCRRITGVDVYRDYIRTAKQDRIRLKIKNASFRVADAAKLPFKAKTFDLIYSSRGPLSAGPEFMREAKRVLKPGGLLAEETIGEQDKIKLKKIFGRGQNYPIRESKLGYVRSLLTRYGFRLLWSEYYLYYQRFAAFREVLRILLRTPIIPEFSQTKDKVYLDKIKRQDKGRGIILGAHRLLWTAKLK